jgi:hypothetical protein
MFRSCWAIFRENSLDHYGCVYTVKCECALGFILRFRGIVYCPRHPPFERYRVLSASSSVWEVSCTVRVILRLRGIVYCPRHPPFERYRVLCASSSVWEVSCIVRVTLRLRGIVYCPRHPPFERYRVLSASSSVWEVSCFVRADRGRSTIPLKRRMKSRAHSYLTVQRQL